MDQKDKIKNAIRNVGLALSTSHNIIATDDPRAEPDEKHWRTDHQMETNCLDFLESVLNGTDSDPLCNDCNKCHEMRRLQSH